MTWDLPLSVKIGGQDFAIRDKCDYRVVLDAVAALSDIDLTDEQKVQCALFIFYEDAPDIPDYETAIREMFNIIRGGEDEEIGAERPKLMDWEHDFPQLAPPVGRVLGYDVRTPGRYTHWYTFLGGYMEIGDCTFSNIVTIRNKRTKGIKLEKWELEFYRNHRKLVDIPIKLTAEEKALLGC